MGMWPHPDFGHQVSLEARASTRMSQLGEEKPAMIIHSGGNLDRHRSSAADPAFPGAHRAALDVHLSGSLATVAFFRRGRGRKADLILCASLQLQHEILRLAPGLTDDRTKVTPIGVEVEAFESAVAAVRAAGEGGRLRVVSTRHLEPLYDLETLVRAVPLVLREVPDAEFVVVGDGGQREELAGLAARLGVTDSVRFAGRVTRDVLPHYLACADVYVSTSLSDGTSISLLEAMACGLAVVVTDIPANRPWVVEGRNGCLFAAGDHEALARRLAALLRDEHLRQRLGKVGRQVVSRQGDFRREMEKVEEGYQSLACGGPDDEKRSQVTDG